MGGYALTHDRFNNENEDAKNQDQCYAELHLGSNF
jgi:hypothetical protein